MNLGETARDYRRSYVSPVCGHEFHLACARRWARFRANEPTVPCPSCRTPWPQPEVTELRGPPFNAQVFFNAAREGRLEEVNQQLANNGAVVDARDPNFLGAPHQLPAAFKAHEFREGGVGRCLAFSHTQYKCRSLGSLT